MNCETFCKATYFNEKCGCSPAPYNIDNCTYSSLFLGLIRIFSAFKECTPLETVTCMNEKMKHEENGGLLPIIWLFFLFQLGGSSSIFYPLSLLIVRLFPFLFISPFFGGQTRVVPRRHRATIFMVCSGGMLDIEERNAPCKRVQIIFRFFGEKNKKGRER